MLFHSIVALSLLLAVAPACAKLTEEGNFSSPSRCPDGKASKDTKQLYKGTDSKGNTFILSCVDNNHYEGRWTRDGKEEILGKCTFPGGLNFWYPFLDSNGDFARIVWWNIDPGTGIKQSDIVGKPGETPEDYIKRIQKLVEEKKAASNLYDTAKRKDEPKKVASDSLQAFDVADLILWDNQTISSFRDGLLDDFVTLAPEETFFAYSDAGLSFLQLDPAMLSPLFEPQIIDGMIQSASEPGTLGLLGLGSLLMLRRSRQCARGARRRGAGA